MLSLYALYSKFGETSVTLIALAIILLAGFFMTRLTKLAHLPNVTAYIVAGIIIGPSVLGLIPPDMLSRMEFVSDIALAFIAFGIGKFFKVETLKKMGWQVVIIALMQSFMTGLLVTFAIKFIFGMSWSFALILGSIATATAPASTMMTIRQYHARGEFIDTLLQVIAFDNVICLLTFSVTTAVVAAGSDGGSVAVLDVLMPIVYNIIAIVLGVVCGVIAKLALKKRSEDNRLIIIIAMLVGIAGLCSLVNVSPLLSCMVFGAVYINFAKDKILYRQLNHFTPPIMTMFFVVSGMTLDLKGLVTAGLVGIVYFAVRIIGKFCGSYLGCLFTKRDKKIRNNLGFALIPAAGVAIGLAFLGQRILPPDIGNLLLTIVLASSVMYEIVGPVSAKCAIFRCGCVDKNYLTRKADKTNIPQTNEDILLDKTNIPQTNEDVLLDKSNIPQANEDILLDKGDIPKANEGGLEVASSVTLATKDDGVGAKSDF